MSRIPSLTIIKSNIFWYNHVSMLGSVRPTTLSGRGFVIEPPPPCTFALRSFQFPQTDCRNSGGIAAFGRSPFTSINRPFPMHFLLNFLKISPNDALLNTTTQQDGICLCDQTNGLLSTGAPSPSPSLSLPIPLSLSLSFSSPSPPKPLLCVNYECPKSTYGYLTEH